MSTFDGLCAARVAATVVVCEADSYAAYALWERWAIEAGDGPCRVPWQSLNPGRTVQVGTLAGMPVMVTTFWATIDGATVCFWSSDSMVVDHRLVRAYLRATFTRAEHTDAMNFCGALAGLRRARDHKPQRPAAPLKRWAAIVPGRPWQREVPHA